MFSSFSSSRFGTRGVITLSPSFIEFTSSGGSGSGIQCVTCSNTITRQSLHLRAGMCFRHSAGALAVPTERAVEIHRNKHALVCFFRRSLRSLASYPGCGELPDEYICSSDALQTTLPELAAMNPAQSASRCSFHLFTIKHMWRTPRVFM